MEATARSEIYGSPAAFSEDESRSERGDAADTNNARQTALQLVPDSPRGPIFANHVFLRPTQGTAFLEFGFVEPATIYALQQLAGRNQPAPEVVQGALAARVALSYETLFDLHVQLHQFLSAVKKDGNEEQG